MNDERSGTYRLYFPVFALRKGALVEFVLTLQMFNEQATTAAGCAALVKRLTLTGHVWPTQAVRFQSLFYGNFFGISDRVSLTTKTHVN